MYHAMVLISLGLASIFPQPSVVPRDDLALNAVLALGPNDGRLFEPAMVVKTCTDVLTSEDVQSADTIGKALYQRAVAYGNLSKHKEAKDDLDLLCRLQPNNAEALIMKGASLARLRSLKEAEEALRSALKLDPANVRAMCFMASICLIKGDGGQATKWVDKALAVDATKNPEVHYIRGVILFQQQQFGQCIEAINKCIQSRPLAITCDAESPYCIRGLALLQLFKSDEALANFQMAKKSNPASKQAVIGLYLCYGASHNWHLAAKMADDLVEMEPDKAIGHLYCARALANVGADRPALAAIAKVQTFSKQIDAPALAEIASVYILLEKYADALACLNDALKKDPDCIAANINKAELLATCPDAKLRDGPTALKLGHKILRLVKSSIPSLRSAAAMVVAEAYAECGSFAEAMEYVDEAIEIVGQCALKKELERQRDCYARMEPYRTKRISKE